MGEIGSKKPKVAIIGAGLAGLAAGRRLHDLAGDLLNIIIFESGDRIGGRILTSEFAGAQVEIGATWIHGIDGSPMYNIAKKAGALIPNPNASTSWERMDGFPSRSLTLAEGGLAVDPELLARISTLFSDLKQLISSGETNGEIGSVGEFFRRGFEAERSENREDWMEEAAFAMHECGERTYTAVDDLESLDLAAEKEYREFPGEHITVPGGYSRVPEFLADALPSGTIRLRRKVSRVEWDPDGVNPVRMLFDDGEIEFADHAIVTVSLGVLKSGVIDGDGLLFSPALPDAKIGAIRRLGFGLVAKLFMELEDEDDGDEQVKPSFPFLRMLFDPSRRVAEIPLWMRRTDSICSIHGGSRVLLAWFVGRDAAEVEKMEEEEIIRGIHATLDAFSPPPATTAGDTAGDTAGGGGGGGGGFGRIGRVRKTGWGKDPQFLGSYSFVAVGSSGDDQDALAEPVPSDGCWTGSSSRLQILFAGEATHRTRYATTHGAYLSGVREAERLLRHYGIRSLGIGS